jgi:hypothetical protein
LVLELVEEEILVFRPNWGWLGASKLLFLEYPLFIAGEWLILLEVPGLLLFPLPQVLVLLWLTLANDTKLFFEVVVDEIDVLIPPCTAPGKLKLLKLRQELVFCKNPLLALGDYFSNR